MKKNFIKLAAALLLIALLSSPALSEEPARIKVLNFNVWGIIGAKARMVRMEAIGNAISGLDPDVVAIEEAFESRHRKALLKSLDESGYEYADWRYGRNVYGSGIMVISKYPIKSVIFEPYRVLGGPFDIEWLGGKGLMHLVLETPYGDLDFFATHAIARMTAIFDENGQYIPGDRTQVDRLLHMYQIDKFVRGRKNPNARSIIAAGDFNVSPEMLEYQFLVRLTGFENSFDELNPGANPSTYSPENNWVKDDFSRIDHVFYKNYDGSTGFWVRPVESKVVLTDRFTNPKNMKEINFSDHYGLYTEFEVVTGEGMVEPSPQGVVQGRCENENCDLPGYEGGEIELTSDNAPVWHDVALREFRTALRKQDRRNKLLIPLAETVATPPDKLPKTIGLDAELPAALKSDYCEVKEKKPRWRVRKAGTKSEGAKEETGEEEQ